METLQNLGDHTRNGDSLWRNRAFTRLWAAQTISQFGSQITSVALPIAAVLVLNAGPMQVGLLGFFQYLPFLLVGLPAGAIVDRMRRRPVLVSCDFGRAVLMGLIPLAYFTGMLTLPLLWVVAFLSGILTVFFDIAYQAYLPSLVPADRLVDGNSKLEVSRSVAQLAGPGAGGFLIRLLSAPGVIAADAISYLLSSLFLFGIKDGEERSPEKAPSRALKDEIILGIRFVRDHRLLRPIAITTAVANLALGGFMQSAFMLYAIRTLNLSTTAIGLIVAVSNGGALLAALVAVRLRNRVGIGPAIVAAAALTALGTLAMGTATRATAFAVLSGGMFVISFASLIYNINQVSLRQAVTPANLLGRMNATMRFLVWGTVPFGALLIGFVAERAGIRASVWLVALISCLATIPVLVSPLRRLAHPPTPTPSPSPNPTAT